MTPKKPPTQSIGERGKARDELVSSLERALQVVTRHTQTTDDSSTGVVVGSTIGPRRQRNEDRVCALTISKGSGPRNQIFVAVVCDGIGGHRHGEESAWKAASAFLAECALSNAESPKETLNAAVRAADNVVYASNRGQGGTTLVAILVYGDGRIGGVNCGDSRLYKSDPAGKLELLSHDQTVGAAIQGAASSTQPYASAFDSELGNYIGIGPDITPEFIQPSHVSAKDAFVLSTDGTWSALGDSFGVILHAAPSPIDAVRRVLTTVNYVNGADNASLAVIPSYERILTSLRQKEGRFGVIDINGLTPDGRIYVSISYSKAEEKASDLPLTHAPSDIERSRARRKLPRPKQESLLEPHQSEPDNEPKKKRKTQRVKVVVVGEKHGHGENDN